MNAKRLVCFLLTVVFCAGILVGCNKSAGSTANGSNTASSTGSSSGVTSQGDVSENTDELIETTFEGETIRVFTAAFNDSYVTEIGDNSNNENCAEVLSLAIKERTEAVEAAYGVTIEEYIMIDPKRYNGSYLDAVREYAVSGTWEYDILYPCLLDAGTMAAEGFLQELSSAPGIRIQNSWWDQTFISDTAIGNQTYYLTGDIGLRAKNSAGCIYFNKQLMDNAGLDYPYQLVRDKEWTIDKAIEMIKQADLSEDTDGDKKITYHDTYGWAGQDGDMQKLFYAAGERMVSVDEQGTLSITVFNERGAKVMDSILSLLQDDADYVRGDDYFGESSTPMVMLLDSFKSDQCLFYSGGMEDALKLGDMKSDFGILPSPLFDSQQEQYYTMMGAWSANAYCIPYGLDEERSYRAQVILDALGSYSVDTVAKTYYDVVLQYQKLRTDDDVEMLKLIFSCAGTDLGDVYRVGGLSGMLTSLIQKPKGSFASSYDSLASSAEKELANLIAKFATIQS